MEMPFGSHIYTYPNALGHVVSEYIWIWGSISKFMEWLLILLHLKEGDTLLKWNIRTPHIKELWLMLLHFLQKTWWILGHLPDLWFFWRHLKQRSASLILWTFNVADKFVTWKQSSVRWFLRWQKLQPGLLVASNPAVVVLLESNFLGGYDLAWFCVLVLSSL